MKAIFLDIDGVLITRKSCREGFGKADKDCVERLNRLTEETKAGLVLSSMWRIGRSIEEITKLLTDWGVQGSLYGKTPEIPGNDYRGIEIATWLADNKHITKFVIIDDDDDMLSLSKYLVHTDFTDGLLDVHVEKAKQILEA